MDTISFSDTSPTDNVQLSQGATPLTSPVFQAEPLNLLNDEEFETTELFKIQIDEETGELVLEDGELHHPQCTQGRCVL